MIKFLKAEGKSYKDIPLLVSLVEQFTAIVQEIKNQSDKNRDEFKDFTTSKLKAKERMAEVVSSYAAAGVYFAMDTARHDLKSELDVTFSEVKYAKDSESIKTALEVEALLLEHKESLAEYLVTEEDFEILRKAIEEFDSLYMARQELTDDTRMDTHLTEVLFQKADDMLTERLDRIVKRLKIQMPDFYKRYVLARMIDNL